MSTLKAKLSHAMNRVEKEDLRVGILLMNHSDWNQEEFELHVEFQPVVSEQRPEWGGQFVGILWGSFVILTSEIPEGNPLAIPLGRGVEELLCSLEDSRRREYSSLPKSPKPTLVEVIKEGIKKGLRPLVTSPYKGPRG
jgi:hypothetical protein